jgi:hypothetical protein
MTAFLGELPTFVYFILIFSFLYSVSALGYFLGIEVGQERGFRLGYARGKLVGTQETNHYFHSGRWPSTEEAAND